MRSLVGGALSMVLVAPCLAQDEQIRTEADQAMTTANGRRAGDFVIEPIPVLSPTPGVRLAAGASCLFQIDGGSSPSPIGGGDLHPDTGSPASDIARPASFDDDRKVPSGPFGDALAFYGVGAGARSARARRRSAYSSGSRSR
jgi:hypothetical protein